MAARARSELHGCSSPLGAAVALEMAARARLGAAGALEMAARARIGAAGALEITVRARPEPQSQWRSKLPLGPASEPQALSK